MAESLLLKLVFTVTTYDTWLVPISLTVGMTRRGNFTFDVERYLQDRSVRVYDKAAGTVRTSSTRTRHQAV